MSGLLNVEALASQGSCISRLLHLKALASQGSCISRLLHLRALASQVSCISGLLHLRSLASQVSCISGLLHLRSLASQVSCISGLMNVRVQRQTALEFIMAGFGNSRPLDLLTAELEGWLHGGGPLAVQNRQAVGVLGLSNEPRLSSS